MSPSASQGRHSPSFQRHANTSSVHAVDSVTRGLVEAASLLDVLMSCSRMRKATCSAMQCEASEAAGHAVNHESVVPFASHWQARRQGAQKRGRGLQRARIIGEAAPLRPLQRHLSWGPLPEADFISEISRRCFTVVSFVHRGERPFPDACSGLRPGDRCDVTKASSFGE